MKIARYLACLLTAATMAYAAAPIPPTVANFTQTDKVTVVHGNCDTAVGYQYHVIFRADGSYQTRDLDGTLIDSGTYAYRVDPDGSRALIDYVTFPPTGGSTLPVQWHETVHFTSATSGTLDGVQTSGGNCTYTCSFTLAPTAAAT